MGLRTGGNPGERGTFAENPKIKNTRQDETK